MNTSTFRCRVLGVLVVPCLVTPLVGCADKQVPGPTYAELVQLYNAELETLDRLENRKRQLIADYEREHAPPATDPTADALSGLLDAADKARRDLDSEDSPDADRSLNPDGAATPDDVLDKAIADAQKTEQLASKLLRSAAEKVGQGKSPVVYSEEFMRRLAELDEQIEQQRARVDRARQQRDALPADGR